jgi:hypothetical protein
MPAIGPVAFLWTFISAVIYRQECLYSPAQVPAREFFIVSHSFHWFNFFTLKLCRHENFRFIFCPDLGCLAVHGHVGPGVSKRRIPGEACFHQLHCR